MEYLDIIRDNFKNHSPIPWWTKFAFHYTDITNVVNILKSGILYSRADATFLNVMSNDNASSSIIDMTDPQTISRVRFYFRPMTPTQYHNEGYKHPYIRYNGDSNANVPVPIFLLFDLNKLLNFPDIQFSETSQAGRGAELYSGVDRFSKLEFDKIYDNSVADVESTKQYRHAEIICSKPFSIANALEHILCRNDIERSTLLNLLKDTDEQAFLKYQSMIKVPKKNVFFNNGLFVSVCSLHDDMIYIEFSNTYARKQYMETAMKRMKIEKLNPVVVDIRLEWCQERRVVWEESIVANVNAEKPIDALKIKKIPDIPSANSLGIKVYFDSKLMCYAIRSLGYSEVLE